MRTRMMRTISLKMELIFNCMLYCAQSGLHVVCVESSSILCRKNLQDILIDGGV